MTTSAFFRSARVALLGMVIAQAIPLLGSLVIVRLYVPAEFGVFSTWLGVVMTSAVLVTGRLEMALVIEADGEPRRFAMAATLATAGDAIRASNPLGRIGQPEDIAGVAIFLGSRASAYTTGAVVPCDGGITEV